jgi:hypothetical protein
VQISQPLEHTEHNLLDGLQAIIPNRARTILKRVVHHVSRWHHPKITYRIRLKVRDDKKVLLLEHSLFLFGLFSGLVLEVLVTHLNDVLTEALALDLVQS